MHFQWNTAGCSKHTMAKYKMHAACQSWQDNQPSAKQRQAWCNWEHATACCNLVKENVSNSWEALSCKQSNRCWDRVHSDRQQRPYLLTHQLLSDLSIQVSQYFASRQRVSCNSFKLLLDILCQVSHTATLRFLVYEHQVPLLCKQCPPEHRTSSQSTCKQLKTQMWLTNLHLIACYGTNASDSCVTQQLCFCWDSASLKQVISLLTSVMKEESNIPKS